MKRLLTARVVLLTVIFTAGMVLAQNAAKDAKARGRSIQQDVKRASRSIRSTDRTDARDTARPAARDVRRRPAEGLARGMMHQQQIRNLQLQIMRRKRILQAETAELKQIKEMAVSEGATKTAALVDNLLSKKETSAAEETGKLEDKMKQIKALMDAEAKKGLDKPKDTSAKPGAKVTDRPRVRKAPDKK